MKKYSARFKNKTFKICSEYLHPIYDPATLAKIVNRLARKINSLQKKQRIDAIAFSGTSGAAVAYPLSYKLRIPLICVRSPVISSHSCCDCEGVVGVKNYVIVDDFIDSGETVDRIKKSVLGINEKANLVAILLYEHEWDEEEFLGAPVFGFAADPHNGP